MRTVNRALLAGVMGVVLIIPACFLTHGNPSGDEGAAGSGVEAGTDTNIEFEHPRKIYFFSEAEHYDYYEGTSGKNKCTGDSDCLVSGCSRSTCAAEVVEIDDNEFCEERMYSSWPEPLFGTCGCISEECQWYFENDYDRHCETDNDCDGLGPPPEGLRKATWVCRENKCHFGFTNGAAGEGNAGGNGGSSGTGDAGVVGGSSGIGGTGGANGGGMTYGIVGQSCKGADNDCNDNGTPVSCCDSKLITGGTFPMGRCETGATERGCDDYYASDDTEEVPEHDAAVADFYLDTFEVTVGRFRKFVEQYDGTAPAQDAGAHPLIAGSGWQSAWNSNLPATPADLTNNLKCTFTWWTWTDTAGANEQYPINCVSWYEAFSFCIWDGGRLPTEAEWEYAAAGGDENRLFPWGSEAPDSTPERVNFYFTTNSSYVDVGTYSDGAGRWGQHDLAGSVFEWVLDWYDSNWYSGTGNTCDNCANLNSDSYRVERGGGFYETAYGLRAVSRSLNAPTHRNYDLGVRCARDAL